MNYSRLGIRLMTAYLVLAAIAFGITLISEGEKFAALPALAVTAPTSLLAFDLMGGGGLWLLGPCALVNAGLVYLFGRTVDLIDDRIRHKRTFRDIERDAGGR